MKMIFLTEYFSAIEPVAALILLSNCLLYGLVLLVLYVLLKKRSKGTNETKQYAQLFGILCALLLLASSLLSDSRDNTILSDACRFIGFVLVLVLAVVKLTKRKN